jgi:hypothetical protein
VIKDARTLTRIRSLVSPPAWEDVWICTDPQGHIQAIGTDSAGRRQAVVKLLARQSRRHGRPAPSPITPQDRSPALTQGPDQWGLCKEYGSTDIGNAANSAGRAP